MIAVPLITAYFFARNTKHFYYLQIIGHYTYTISEPWRQPTTDIPTRHFVDTHFADNINYLI